MTALTMWGAAVGAVAAAGILVVVARLRVIRRPQLSVRVLPRQADEFTCMTCFLVHHRSQLAKEKNGQPICRDCAA